MRYALFAGVLAIVLAMPTPAEARSRVSFFFSVGTHGHYRPLHHPHRFHHPYRFHHRPHFVTPHRHLHYDYRPGFHGRYAVPQVYSPYRYRYGDYRFDDHAYRRSLYGIDRGYYGPAVGRYHYDRRYFPSYHYDRREAYIRR